MTPREDAEHQAEKQFRSLEQAGVRPEILQGYAEATRWLIQVRLRQQFPPEQRNGKPHTLPLTQ